MKPLTKKIMVLAVILIFSATMLYNQFNKSYSPSQVMPKGDVSGKYDISSDGVKSFKVQDLICATHESFRTPYCCREDQKTYLKLLTNISMPTTVSLYKNSLNDSLFLQTMVIQPKDAYFNAELTCDNEYKLTIGDYWIKFNAKGRQMTGMLYDKQITVESDPDCVNCFKVLQQMEEKIGEQPVK